MNSVNAQRVSLWLTAGAIILYSALLVIFTGDIGFDGDDWWVLSWPYWHSFPSSVSGLCQGVSEADRGAVLDYHIPDIWVQPNSLSFPLPDAALQRKCFDGPVLIEGFSQPQMVSQSGRPVFILLADRILSHLHSFH